MNKLIATFNDLEEVKRIHQLENYIDKNTILKEKIEALKSKQKQMINAKEYNQVNQYSVYKKEYEEIYNEIIDFPFVEEYLELLDIVNDELKAIKDIIEIKINNELKKYGI